MSDYRAIHESLMNESGTILPRVGVGVGGGVGNVVLHASYLTTGPVDNFAAASPERTAPEPCSAYGEVRRWLR